MTTQLGDSHHAVPVWSTLFGIATLLLAVAVAVPDLALAQDPNSLTGKKIKLVVPFSPGGSVDGLARTIAEGLQRSSGAQVMVENKPGAGGNIAANQVAKSGGSSMSGSDTISLLINSINHYVNPVLVRNSGYDGFKDFVPVAHLGTMPYVFVAPPASKLESLKDFVAQARAEPGKLSWGFGGNHIDLVVMTVQSAAPLIKQGRIKALAIAGAQRNKVLPQLPAATEQIEQYQPLNGYAFMLAPAGTPDALLVPLQREMNLVLRSEAFARRLDADGAVVQFFATPAEAKTYFDKDGAAWESLTRKAGLKVE